MGAQRQAYLHPALIHPMWYTRAVLAYRVALSGLGLDFLDPTKACSPWGPSPRICLWRKAHLCILLCPGHNVACVILRAKSVLPGVSSLTESCSCNTSPTLKQWFSARSECWPPGNIWQYLETFSSITTGGREVLLASSGWG